MGPTEKERKHIFVRVQIEYGFDCSQLRFGLVVSTVWISSEYGFIILLDESASESHTQNFAQTAPQKSQKSSLTSEEKVNKEANREPPKDLRFSRNGRRGMISNGGASLSGLIRPFLSFFLSFWGLSDFSGISPMSSGIFPICPFPPSRSDKYLHRGILHLRNPIRGRILGNESWTPEFWTRILGSSFFDPVFFQQMSPQKNSPSRNSPPKIHLQKFNPEIGPKKSHCTSAGPLG